MAGTTWWRPSNRVRAIVAFAAVLLLAVVPIARAVDQPGELTKYPGGTWEPQKPQYGTTIERGRQVRMDDGALLTVDVVYPADKDGKRLPGPFPVLLNQDMYAGNPENAVNPPATYGEYFVQRGYIFVHVHDRGTGGSEGHFDPGFGPRVGLDGVELAYWAADPVNVPGANRSVGLQGCSALGVVQLSTLAALGKLLNTYNSTVYVPGPTKDAPGYTLPVTDETHPIKASLPECVGVSVYHEQYNDNGVPSFIWALSLAQPAAAAVFGGYNTQDLSSNYEQSARSLDMIAGGDDGYYRQHWRERDFIRRADEIARTGVPVLTWPGLKEGGPIGVQPLYAALQNASAGRPITAPMLPACGDNGPKTDCQQISTKYQTLMGDWGHAGGLDTGIELEWFETWVKGVDTGLEKADEPIHIKELPSASTPRWIKATSYPMTRSYTPLYLNSDGALSPSKPTVDSPAQLAWPVGPAVTYTVADGFKEDRTILGPSAARLFVESTNTNIHLFLELEDVAPDGTTTPITHGSILGSRRNTDPARSWSSPDGLPVLPYLTLDNDRYLTAGTPVQLDVPLQPTAWRLLAGHKIQLKVNTNAGDKCTGPTALFDAPVGCFFSAPTAASLAGGVYTIHSMTDAQHVAAVNLPIMLSTDVKTSRSGVTGTTNDGAAMPLDWGSGGSRPKG